MIETVTPPTPMPSVIACAVNFPIDVTVATPLPTDTVVSAAPPAARPTGAPMNDSIFPATDASASTTAPLPRPTLVTPEYTVARYAIGSVPFASDVRTVSEAARRFTPSRT